MDVVTPSSPVGEPEVGCAAGAVEVVLVGPRSLSAASISGTVVVDGTIVVAPLADDDGGIEADDVSNKDEVFVVRFGRCCVIVAASKRVFVVTCAVIVSVTEAVNIPSQDVDAPEVVGFAVL